MAAKLAVKFERELKLNRNYNKTQHAWGITPEDTIKKWLGEQ